MSQDARSHPRAPHEPTRGPGQDPGNRPWRQGEDEEGETGPMVGLRRGPGAGTLQLGKEKAVAGGIAGCKMSWCIGTGWLGQHLPGMDALPQARGREEEEDVDPRLEVAAEPGQTGSREDPCPCWGDPRAPAGHLGTEVWGRPRRRGCAGRPPLCSVHPGVSKQPHKHGARRLG